MKPTRSFFSNVAAIAWKEAMLMRHDRALLLVIGVQPIVMMAIFGTALSNKPGNVPWVVLDRSQTAVSRRLVAEIDASGYFLPSEAVGSYEEARARLRRGDALAALVVPRELGRETERGHPEVQLLLDGADPLSAARVAGIVGGIARNVEIERLAVDSPRPPLDVRGRFRFNATLQDRIFFLSVFAGMLLTNLCIPLTSLGLVGERESGTYEHMLAQPTRAIEIALGKLVPNVVLSYGVLLLAVVGGGVVFGFWPRGSWLALFLVTLPFVLASLSIGVLISTIAHSSAQAVFVSPLFIMPSFVLSGVMMPYQLMPDGIREFGAVYPLRWYQIALRAIVVRGGGLVDVWLPMLVMYAIFGALLLVVGWRMKPRLG